MTAQVLERPASVSTDPDDLAHRCCCDDDVALCGWDLRGAVDLDEDDDSRDCPLCEAAYEDEMPCPVAGCPVRPGVVTRVKRWWRSR